MFKGLDAVTGYSGVFSFGVDVFLEFGVDLSIIHSIKDVDGSTGTEAIAVGISAGAGVGFSPIDIQWHVSS